MHGLQHGVEYAALFQYYLPGHGAQQEIHPHGKNKDEHDKALSSPAAPFEYHGQRESE
jgi:hypothetical protein